MIYLQDNEGLRVSFKNIYIFNFSQQKYFLISYINILADYNNLGTHPSELHLGLALFKVTAWIQRHGSLFSFDHKTLAKKSLALALADINRFSHIIHKWQRARKGCISNIFPSMLAGPPSCSGAWDTASNV